jgi:dipeptidyl-peptidase 4
MKLKCLILFNLFFVFAITIHAQQGGINWTADGTGYTKSKDGNIVKIDPKTEAEIILIKKEQLTPAGSSQKLTPQSFVFNATNTKVMLFTNTIKVWRYKTMGDYWLLDLPTNKLMQIGKDRPARSLMFAKLSPDGNKVAYVSEHNIYMEDLVANKTIKLTADGTRKLINGTFDWVYEEEFGCRDGFRWSPDSRKIAFWQVDATKIRDYFMLNTTDSNYSKVIPVEYPKVGEAPSPVKIGVINLDTKFIKWMNIDGDPQQHYLPRMEWSGTNELVVQQLDRKQQESKIMYCNATDGNATTIWAENDKAWVDLNASGPGGDPSGWTWINNHQDFIWVSEKDGWRHIYKISKDGKAETNLTKGLYDIGEIKSIDEANNYIYFTASPTNATQLYLYRVKLNPKKEEAAELLSNANLKGTHEYDISPNAKFAMHSFSNYKTPNVAEWITLPDNKVINSAKSIATNIKVEDNSNIEYIQLTTEEGVTLDAWINKPKNFDASKKYPMLLAVYGEPAAATVGDSYGNQDNNLYNGDMNADGYIQVSIDNRGTPSLKGAAWRKAIYRSIGNINIKDLALGTKKLLANRPYIDRDRVAVWGWSGGGSSTLNLLFRYPEIFKTGIAVAAVANQLNYQLPMLNY